MHFQFDYLCSVTTNDIIFAAVAQCIKNTYYMKQPDLYYVEAIKMTSQAWLKFTENTRLRLVFSIKNLTRLVTSFYGFKVA